MITIEKNHTRYNTKDLEGLLSALADVKMRQIRAPQQVRTIRIGQDDTIAVEPLYGDRPGVGAYYRRQEVHGDDPAHITPSKLFLRSPAALAERYPLEALASVSGENLTAPAAFVQEVARIVLLDAANLYYDLSRSSDSTDLRREINRVVAGVAANRPLRIMPQKETPGRKCVPLTRDQKIARLRDHGFFGTGGRLYGPPSAGRSGTRAATYQWEGPLESAERMYSRELAVRQKYEGQLREMGASAESYETWPEYLRRLANEWEGQPGGGR